MYDADYESYLEELREEYEATGQYTEQVGDVTVTTKGQPPGLMKWTTKDSGKKGEPVGEFRRYNPSEGKYEVKDSGKRFESEDGMVRDTSEGKPQFSLMFPKGIPYEDQLMTRVADLYYKGAVKYSPSVEIGTEKLVEWCSCEHQTAILTGLTTLDVCAETVMNGIFATVTRSLLQDSGGTQPSGPSEIYRESAQRTWLTVSEALATKPFEAGIDAGPVSGWLLRTASDYLLARLVSARSALTTLAQARTWITTTVRDSREDFYAHAVTKAWGSSEIRLKLFGEHLTTCSIHRLQATSRGIWCLEGRNWEKSNTEQSLAKHEDCLMRHVVKFLLGMEDEDHAAAVVWNVNAVLLTRYKIAHEVENETTTKIDEDFIAKTNAAVSVPDEKPFPKVEFKLGDELLDKNNDRWSYYGESLWDRTDSNGTWWCRTAKELAAGYGPIMFQDGAYAGITMLKDGSLRWG